MMRFLGRLVIRSSYSCRYTVFILSTRSFSFQKMFCFTSVESQYKNSLLQQENCNPGDLSRQLVMHHESLHRRFYHKNKTFQILEYLDFCAKFSQKICIHIV